MINLLNYYYFLSFKYLVKLILIIDSGDMQNQYTYHEKA